MSDWYVRHNGKTIGPVGSNKLKELAREGRLSRDCEIRQDGSNSWHPITKVKGLFPENELAVVPAPVPVPVQAAPQPMMHYPQQPMPVHVIQQAPAPAPVINITNTVINNNGKRWSRLVAGFLSLIIPGLGQLYKGQPFNGLVWFVLTAIGYACFIIPGVVLHICCVLGAISGRNT